MLYSDYALMRAIAAGLKWQAAKSNIKIEPEIVFPQGTSDATVQAAQVRAAAPDYVVWVGAGGFDVSVTNQLLDIGIKPDKIIHPYGFTTMIRGWGKRSVGSYYGTFFDANLENLTDESRDLWCGESEHGTVQIPWAMIFLTSGVVGDRLGGA